MGWKLWLDDQIDDLGAPNRWVPEGFIGAASTAQAITLCKELGPPEYIDFDHDLGVDESGVEDNAKRFCKWLEENYPNNPPTDWHIHSQNRSPDAGPWIDSFLRSWVRSLKMGSMERIKIAAGTHNEMVLTEITIYDRRLHIELLDGVASYSAIDVKRMVKAMCQFLGGDYAVFAADIEDPTSLEQVAETGVIMDDHAVDAAMALERETRGDVQSNSSAGS